MRNLDRRIRRQGPQPVPRRHTHRPDQNHDGLPVDHKRDGGNHPRLKARDPENPDAARSIEIERLDSIYRQIYPLALQQDAKAIDQCLKIGEQRLRLMDAPTKAQKGLLKAYEDTVKALDDRLKPEDSALIQSGRMIASQIDSPSPTHRHRSHQSLYLMPHLMNVLRELGATPDARGSIANAIQDAKPKQVSDEFEEYLAKMT